MFRRSRSNACEPEAVRRARERAERAADERRRVEAREAEAEQIGMAIRNALQRNHFGEAIERSWARRGI
jgi:hypothetical protein